MLLPLIPRVVVFQSIDDEPPSQLYWGDVGTRYSKVVVNRHNKHFEQMVLWRLFLASLNLTLITYAIKRVVGNI